MPDLFDLPPAPRMPGYKERTTSREAALRIAGEAHTMRGEVLQAFRDVWPAGLTADEAAAMVGRSVLAIRPRISEIKDAGQIEATESRRKNASGMSARVWKLVKR